MDFSALKSINQQIDSTKQRRHQEACQSNRKGFECLLRAFSENFSDRSRLKEASQHFIKAIENNRKSPSPYLGMGLFYFILSSPDKALNYLKEGLKENPGHAGIADLIGMVLHKKSTHNNINSILTAHIDDLDEQDRLYDEIENKVTHLLKEVLGTPLFEIQSNPQPDTLLKLTDQLKQWQEQQKILNQNITKLDTYFDMSDIRALVEKINISIKEKTLRLEKSQNILILIEKIEKTHHEVNYQRDQLQVQKTAFNNSELEKILDLCDAIADQIDAFSEVGLPSEYLENSYGNLIRSVEKLQEILDDIQETVT
jgi:tetratricopeptide (TPR) repeat protein